eukprot:gene17905-25045_t
MMKVKECNTCGQGFTEENELIGHAVASASCLNGLHVGPLIRITVMLEVQKLTESVNKLSEEFTKYKPMFDKAGLTYELAVRREVRELKGVSYARSFRVENLAGLARISCPKDISNEFEPIQDWNTHMFLQRRTQQLASRALSLIPAMQLFLTQSTSVNKKSILTNAFKDFNLLKSDTDKIIFLESHVLGLIAFSSIAYVDHNFFEEVLECDVRGESQLRGTNTLRITLGEIKKGRK